MKVLFISSGNSNKGVSPIIKNQGESLNKLGIEITYYTLKGKGIWGYYKNIKPLKKFLAKNDFDIIHAHFSYTAFVASLSGAKPIVVSLMGWNVKLWYLKLLIKFFNCLFWDACITKSEAMKDSLGIKNIVIIPNGLDFNRFRPIDKGNAQKKLNWTHDKKHILFAANPNRPIKNYRLALEAFKILDRNDVELHSINDIPNEEMVFHYNASDVVILTSIAEGSSNVIKEAMACNCPIVSTDVGDAKEIIKDTEGCFICKQDASNIALNINNALNFNNKTTGREKISYLDEKLIAKRIVDLYENVLTKHLGIRFKSSSK